MCPVCGNVTSGDLSVAESSLFYPLQIDNDVIEYTVHYFSSLLLIHPPNHGCQLTEYTKFIEQIRNDVIDLLRYTVHTHCYSNLSNYIVGLMCNGRLFC